jgi:nucleotide-binding universal stress UspA family protein
MYRDLLVHVDGSLDGRRRVRFAVDLSIRTGARLSGLHVTPPVEVPPLFKPSRVAHVAENIAVKLVSDARAAAAIFKAETEQRLPGAGWFETAGDMVQGISDRARYADLVIVGQYEWQGSPPAHSLPIAHSLALQCGRPVLVVPADAQPRKLEKVAIAWDGSREAVRVVHDALPLLRLSRSVEIVAIAMFDAENANADAKNLSTHLANHGIEASIHILRSTAADEHETLRKQIEQRHYDVLVMGAYSSPAWLQFIFGGATRSILLSSTIPVLVSH